MNEYQEIAAKIREADAVLIGASNGFSITEGIHLFANNEAMHSLFHDLQEAYGLRNLLDGMMGRWPSYEQMWGFWSRMVNHYSGNYQPTQVMQDLQAIVKNKDCFLITSNGEQHFQLAGFPEEKIYEVEGSWLTLTCANHCSETMIPGLEKIKTMADHETNGRVPTEFIPLCPHCGAPLIPTMAAGVADHRAKERYARFLQNYHGKKLVILELGIGARNTLIKAPLMRLTEQEEHATYVTFNLSELYIAPEIQSRSYAVQGYLDQTLQELRQACRA